MRSKNHTIKDIARMAGVSAGTVDRVLHNRGDVSEASKEKVNRVLEQIDYQPNMYAIALAAKKHYRFVCVIPEHMADDYWHSVAVGIRRAAEELRPFNVEVLFFLYIHADEASYNEACRRAAAEGETDAVLIAPNFRQETIALTQALDAKQIPYLFIDFNIEQTQALSYIGQDSLTSGYIAARILMRGQLEDEEIALFLGNHKNNPAEIQMCRRVEGFMKYMDEHSCHAPVHSVVIHKDDADANRRTMDDFFALHPRAVLGAVFNSRVYQVADYLQASGHTMKRLIGYDLLRKNVAHLKAGTIDLLIGQRPELQGYRGVKALCEYVVFKRPVPSLRYMPIDILMKENIDFYFEFEP